MVGAVALGCLVVSTLLSASAALVYRRRCARLAAEHRELYARALRSLDAATEALAAAEAEWRLGLDRIQQDYDDTLQHLRIRQATTLARLQTRLPQPRTRRLHGDERP